MTTPPELASAIQTGDRQLISDQFYLTPLGQLLEEEPPIPAWPWGVDKTGRFALLMNERYLWVARTDSRDTSNWRVAAQRAAFDADTKAEHFLPLRERFATRID